MKQASELIYTSKLKVLLFAEAGVGKTYLIGTAGKHPKLGPVLVLSLEGGLDSLSHMPGVYYEEITSIQQLENIYQQLHDTGGVYQGVQFNMVAIDSATEMQTLDITDIVEAKLKRNNKRTVDEVYLEDYGVSTRRLGRIFRAFRNLDMHTIFTCLPKHTYSSSGAIVNTEVLLTPKLAGLFRGYMSFVWYEYIAPDQQGNYKRWMMTEGNGTVKCKSRGHGFNQYLQQTFKHIIPQEYLDLGWIYDRFLEAQLALKEETFKED